VYPGAPFSVQNTNGAALPDTIGCTITASGVTLQQNTLDTSGGVSLALGDKFGAMQLEGCDDLSCTERLSYAIDIENVGEVPMEVTVADLELNGNVLRLVDGLGANPLDPGVSAGLVQSVEIGVCAGGDFAARINVEANPPNGNTCEDSAEISKFM
jgi:hypothetical protein